MLYGIYYDSQANSRSLEKVPHLQKVHVWHPKSSAINFLSVALKLCEASKCTLFHSHLVPTNSYCSDSRCPIAMLDLESGNDKLIWVRYR